MAGWFEELMERFRRRPARRQYFDSRGTSTDSSIPSTLFDSSSSWSGASDGQTQHAPASFDDAFDGGESGGAGASADSGGGGDSGGGDSGGGDGGGGGGGGD